VPASSANPPHGLDRAGDHAVHVDPVRVRSATPASSLLISSRSASSASNRSSSVTSSSELRRTAGSSWSFEACRTSAAIRTVVNGVRSSWLTSEVNRRCSGPELLELADLGLDAAGHLVVRLGQPRHLVVAVHGHAFVEVPVGEPLGDLGGLPDRPDDLPGDQARDPGQQQEQHEPADDQRALHQRERALLGVQREQQVELQVSARCAHRLADDQRRDLDAPAAIVT
jgi:hypothetical protein